MRHHDSALDLLHERMRQAESAPAILSNRARVSHSALLSLVLDVHVELDAAGIEAGQVVLLDADFSPSAAACLIALLERGAVVALVTAASAERRQEQLQLCEAGHYIHVGPGDELEIRATHRPLAHPLLQRLAERRIPGLILFSSGSSGSSKAAVHELDRLLDEFRNPGGAARVVATSSLGHIGGVGLLFGALFSGGAIVVPEERSPNAVCASIETHQATVLTTTPTFVRLALHCQAFECHDVASLQVITYGSEVMPESTLRALAGILPGIRLSQTYALTEVGWLPVQSVSSDSVLLRVCGDGSWLRIRDGTLEIKTESAMLGYLNAPSPFTEDGWLRTGDAVQLEGDHLRVLGRAAKLIDGDGNRSIQLK